MTKDNKLLVVKSCNTRTSLKTFRYYPSFNLPFEYLSELLLSNVGNNLLISTERLFVKHDEIFPTLLDKNYLCRYLKIL